MEQILIVFVIRLVRNDQHPGCIQQVYRRNQNMGRTFQLRTREELFQALETLYTRIRNENKMVDRGNVIIQLVGMARTLIEDEELSRVNQKIATLEREIENL